MPDIVDFLNILLLSGEFQQLSVWKLTLAMELPRLLWSVFSCTALHLFTLTNQLLSPELKFSLWLSGILIYIFQNMQFRQVLAIKIWYTDILICSKDMMDRLIDSLSTKITGQVAQKFTHFRSFITSREWICLSPIQTQWCDVKCLNQTVMCVDQIN